VGYSLQQAIRDAQASLPVSSQDVPELSDYEKYMLAAHIKERFVNGKEHRWWWEHWKVRTLSVQFSRQNPERFPLIIPPPHDHIYVIFPTESPQCAYEGTLSTIVALLWEIVGLDEFCLVGSRGDWLMYENHHDRSVFVGLWAMRSLKAYMQSHPEDIENVFISALGKRSYFCP